MLVWHIRFLSKFPVGVLRGRSAKLLTIADSQATLSWWLGLVVWGFAWFLRAIRTPPRKHQLGEPEARSAPNNEWEYADKCCLP